MNFLEIAINRQSCRDFDPTRNIDSEQLSAVINATRLAPSACNSQPYHFTVCKNEYAKKVAAATVGVGINKFTENVPVFIVVSETNYNKTAALGAKLKNNDYRSIDIGIAVAYLTAEATAQGIATCILGWFNNDKIKEICSLKDDVRLVIAIGYAKDDTLRDKKRKSVDDLVNYLY